MRTLSPGRAIAGLVGVLALAAAFALIRWPGRIDCPVDNPTITLEARSARLQVEVATNDAARFCGLAFRDHLPAGSGMLFVYPRQQTLEFWMKDTRIPLALAFIDAGRRITEIHLLTPELGEGSVLSSKPVLFALETDPDWFRANGVAVGDTVRFVLPGDLVIE